MINFLKYRYICGAVSLLAVVATIIGYFAMGGFQYSVDFTGGTQVLLSFKDPVASAQVKDVLEKQGLQGLVTREFSKTEILVRVKEFSNDTKGFGDRIRSMVEKEFPGNTVTILSTDSVGAGVGAALRKQSTIAILLALLLMLIYIGIRFQIAFAAGAVLAILHDAIIVLAVFLFFGKEISVDVIGALLAILGYSINDTIVIFSRIRENMKKQKGLSLYEIANMSLNQTLKRTLLTSLSTAIPVVTLFIFGGEGLRDLSLALLVGIVVGTYSSIYIASAVMLMLRRGQAKALAS